jgi:prolipoprotein diacylglyceryltransferase
MQQVLFHLPFTEGLFPPDGVPVHGFGVMLFITFILCVWFLGWRSRKWVANLPKERVQDLVIVVFIGGLLGARITYMIVEGVPLNKILRIWEGGIVLYGGIISGALAFIAFHHFFLKKAGVSIWKLGDVAGPAVALGIALGRVGCFLNGCCYGHVAPEGCPSAGFPLMTCPARDVVVNQQAYQTPTGFTVRSGPNGMQSVIDRVEPASAAERAGLQPGDLIVGVNGRKNSGVLVVASDEPELMKWVESTAQAQNARVERDAETGDSGIKIVVDDPAAFAALRTKITGKGLFVVRVFPGDTFTDLIRHWPRGEQSLALEVQRGSETINIGPFTPRTIGLHPTQLYEVISMFLLIAFLMCYYPFRKYDGQVFTLFLVGYALHRFLNETLRNDTETVGIPQLHMSLSQNISVLMLLAAAGFEFFGRRRGRPAVAPPAV